MKTILLALLIAASALAQLPAPPAKAVLPKRPLGVPADAKPFNGKWYKVYLEKKSWHAARDKCKELGGQLVTVPDAATWEFVRSMNTVTAIWLGATDEKTTGVWVWSDESGVKTVPWAPNQPDNAGGVEHYMVMWNKVAADIPNDGKVGALRVDAFVCEWPAK